MQPGRVLDEEQCHTACESRDARFDGWFFVGVTTTKIYCRPSCPARPKRENKRFFTTAAAAQQAGFRACRRCRPDSAPGSPEWNTRADLAGRAMRLIGDGIVDREGVSGLATRLNYSERHLNRQLVAELGVGPLALARAQRAHNARVLIETTEIAFTNVAFAAGFASIRQFNDTIRAVFAQSPTEMRATAVRERALGRRDTPSAATLDLRLAYRQPFAATEIFAFLGLRAVPGVETWDGLTYQRVLDLPHGWGIVALTPGDGYVRCQLDVEDWRDVGAGVYRSRELLDLDTDPAAIDDTLRHDPALAPLIARRPGLRSPGHVDGAELAIRALLGQQITVVAARTMAARLVAAVGRPLDHPRPGLTHRFPRPDDILQLGDRPISGPVARATTLVTLCRALAAGDVAVDAGGDRDEVRAKLMALKGIGPWTAGYISMRALRDPDVFLPTDIGVKHGLSHAGITTDLDARGTSWRPWRSYVVHHLWASL